MTPSAKHEAEQQRRARRVQHLQHRHAVRGHQDAAQRHAVLQPEVGGAVPGVCQAVRIEFN